VFILQPAEEGSSLLRPDEGRSWGAKLMLEEGLFKDLKPDAVFALHVMPGRSGEISYRTGATAASSDNPAKAAPNHNPNFFVDEKALVVGTRTMASLAVNSLMTEPTKKDGP
jgi:metal-dependent amidase/aminoacylase/carboxypeptidase family protein